MDSEGNRYCARELIFFDLRFGFGFNILQKKRSPLNFVNFTSQGRPGVDTILKMGKFYVWSHVVRTEAIWRVSSLRLKATQSS